MKHYRITEKAGPYIAGRRNPGAGETLALSARAAAHELRLGTLVDLEAQEKAAARGRAAERARKKAEAEPAPVTDAD